MSLFAEVKGGEGAVVVLMFVNIFLILAAYYVLKTVREGLVLRSDFFGFTGAQAKAISNAVLAGLLIFIVPAYSWLASKISRLRLLNYALAFVIGSLAVFFVLGKAKINIGIAFFLWLGIVNVFLIAQFWSYANDIYSEAQGKRLFAVIGIGASLGAIFGPKIVSQFEEHTYPLMVGAAAVFGVAILLYNAIERLTEKTRSDSDEPEAPRQPLSKDGAFALVLRSRYLFLMAMLILVTNVVNTTGGFILDDTVERMAKVEVPDTSFPEVANAEERTLAIKEARGTVTNGFFGDFYFWMNLVSFLIQAFLVSRIFKFLGVRIALFILPLVALGGYVLIGLIGGIALTRWVKTAENATDYSLQNTVKHALFLPTTREEKYKAKAAIDTFFVRGGDALSAGVVILGTATLGLAATQLAWVLAGVIVIWLFLAAAIGVEYRKLSTTEGVAAEAMPEAKVISEEAGEDGH